MATSLIPEPPFPSRAGLMSRETSRGVTSLSSKKTKVRGRTPDLDLLVFGAHPDDAELVAGGTIAKMARRGWRVGIVDATAGETGTRGTADRRARESTRAARILGVAVRENLHLPDGHLASNESVRRAVVESIRRLKPRVIVAPHGESRHPDHGVLATVVRDATFLAGLRRWKAVGEPWKPEVLIQAVAFLDVRPSFLIDISAEFETKVRSIRAHRSQVEGARQLGDVPRTGRPLIESIRAIHAYYGSMIDRLYAEPFVTAGGVELDDLMDVVRFNRSK